MPVNCLSILNNYLGRDEHDMEQIEGKNVCRKYLKYNIHAYESIYVCLKSNCVRCVCALGA